MIPAKRFRVILCAVLVVVGAGGWLISSGADGQRKPLGLFTSLPILWNEAPDVAGLLNSDTPPHWAKAALMARGDIVPLDRLDELASSGLTRLVIAQPRPFSPAENVALDVWVTGGGKLLLLADPALTAESNFGIADRRRPQAVVLLSPILTRWGLRLEFDDAQIFGERQAQVMGVAVPVNLAGRFQLNGGADCRSWADGLAVSCGIGKGRVIALADAALLDADDQDGTRRSAFDWLLTAAFAAH